MVNEWSRIVSIRGFRKGRPVVCGDSLEEESASSLAEIVAYIELLMADAVGPFYDEFAEHYHLMFEDWEASMTRQAAAIRSILQLECRLAAGTTILDCA